MYEWKEMEIQEGLIDIIDYRGKTPPKSNSGITLISAANVKGGDLDFTKTSFISVNNYKAWTTRGFTKPGDVLITTEAPAGEVALLPDNKTYQISRRVIALRTDEKKLHNEFLYFAILDPRIKAELLSASRGSTVPRLLKTDITQFKILTPNYDLQVKTVKVLGAIKAKIDLLHRQNKTLEAMSETLFRQWFVEEAQEDWEEVDLEYVTQKITDGAHKSPPTVEVGLPMGSVKDMHPWGINRDSCRKISETDYEELVRNDCRPLKNDIIIAKDGSYLKHVFVAPTDLDLVILSSIAILRPNGKYNPLLLSIYLKMNSTREALENIVTGAVIPRIVLKDFRKFKFKLPPLKQQIDALKTIEPIYMKCWENINQIRTLEKLRDTLLPKLMSGEVRLRV